MTLGFLRRKTLIPTAPFKVSIEDWSTGHNGRRRISDYLRSLVSSRVETITGLSLDWQDDENASFRLEYGGGQFVTGTVKIGVGLICLTCHLPVHWGRVYGSVLVAFRRQMKEDYRDFDRMSVLQLSANGPVVVRQ